MTRFFHASTAFLFFALLSGVATAQEEPRPSADDASWSNFELTNEVPVSANDETVKPMSLSAKLRLERAVYRDQQRVARIEANAWMGYQPLRPSWSSIPMMASRYPSRQTIYIPVYVP